MAHIDHPFYGVARLAIYLGWNKKKVRRIRNLSGIAVLVASKKRRVVATLPETTAPPNILKHYAKFRNALKPQSGMDYSGMTKLNAWVQDFTYLWFNRKWYYLAAVLDLSTRQIVGWSFGLNHNSKLIVIALKDALSRHLPPGILHSDQGSEYLSYEHLEICQRYGIKHSVSNKASPWQNGFMERFFGSLKPELGKLNQYQDVTELYEAIALQIYYYNNIRIHTALKMSPVAYAKKLKTNRQVV